MNAGLRAMAVRFPDRVVTNDHWRTHHPEMVAKLDEMALAEAWSTRSASPATAAFDRAMAPFLSDPFRGTRMRRWFADNTDPVALEAATALDALAAASLTPADVDLCIVGTFPPPQVNVGNAAYLAKALGITAPAWNLEATCSSSLMALQTALGLVTAGQYRTILVVTSCAYSQVAPSSEVVSLANGDGACAMVVGAAPRPGLLAAHAVNTTSTCDALRFELDLDANGAPAVRMRLQKGGGQKIREAAEPAFLECVRGALDKAGLTVSDVDFFAFNSSTAWLVPFYCDLLGVSQDKTIDTHTSFANTGPILVPSSMFYGAHAGKIPNGGVVLAFGIGNTSNASALILRWDDVRLAPVQVPLSD